MNAVSEKFEDTKNEHFKTLQAMKRSVKETAREISELKKEVRETQKSCQYAGSMQSSIAGKQRDARILNIAYALLKGRKYLEVENKVKQNNEITRDKWQDIVNLTNSYGLNNKIYVNLADSIGGKVIVVFPL